MAPTPILLTTWSFGLRAGRDGWALLEAGGAALDAVEATCIAAETDAEIDSVGYGGLPDCDGRPSFDGCVMISPRCCGSACFVRSTPHAVSIARQVMERTEHVMLAGEGADQFAARVGIPPRETLSPAAMASWREWSRQPAIVDQSRDGSSSSGRAAAPRPVDAGPEGGGRLFYEPDPEDRFRHHDTIGVLALDRGGRLAGGCTTSGTPYKVPGRGGDSPIIGHGLYVDPAVGGATATGAGELIMGVCGAFLVVELLRQGRSPVEAAAAVIKRIADSGPVAEHHQVAVLALRSDGVWGAAALRQGYRSARFDLEIRGAVEPDAVLL